MRRLRVVNVLGHSDLLRSEIVLWPHLRVPHLLHERRLSGTIRAFFFLLRHLLFVSLLWHLWRHRMVHDAWRRISIQMRVHWHWRDVERSASQIVSIRRGSGGRIHVAHMRLSGHVATGCVRLHGSAEVVVRIKRNIILSILGIGNHLHVIAGLLALALLAWLILSTLTRRVVVACSATTASSTTARCWRATVWVVLII